MKKIKWTLLLTCVLSISQLAYA
ncbi:MAG: hypothetical protein UZ08_BCD001000096, partial [Candidatus Parvibacillus calidus]